MDGVIIASTVVEAEGTSLVVETAAVFKPRIAVVHRQESRAVMAGRTVGLPQHALDQQRIIAHLTAVPRIPQQLIVRRPVALRTPPQRMVVRRTAVTLMVARLMGVGN